MMEFFRRLRSAWHLILKGHCNWCDLCECEFPAQRGEARQFIGPPTDLADAVSRIKPEDTPFFVQGATMGLYKVFKCPDCFMVSHNPNDIENSYCGNCHQFKGHA